MKRISSLVIAGATLLSACTTVQRHQASGYSDSSNWSRRSADEEIETRTRVLSSDQRETAESKALLRGLESRISSDEDRKQYFRIKPFLASDLERVEFLKLPDRRARERWVRALGVLEGRAGMERNIATAVDDGDIMLGMPKAAVLESWGDPVQREVAGNPDYQNERWTYYNYVNSPDGYQREARIIYFESGHVSGWETR